MNDSARYIVIAGDFCPVPSNVELLAGGDVGSVFSESLLSLFHDSCGAVLNLEVPLTDTNAPIAKSGPCLRAPRRVVASLEKLNLIAVGMANNHVLDQGSSGFADTLEVLSSAGIASFGGGMTVFEARKPFITEIAGRRIGFYACAEHEFTIAQKDSPGANPFDCAHALEDVSALAGEVDFVVVLYHGMKEFYRYPSPETRRRCRALIDAGASFVACQHSHCIGCEESYSEGRVLYGQGDFCFAKGDSDPMRKDGLVILIDLDNFEIEYVPIINDGKRVLLAEGEAGNTILDAFRFRSKEIRRQGFVEGSWERFSLGIFDDYAKQILLAMEPRWIGFVARILGKIGFPVRFRSGTDVAFLLNMVQCEAHNEVARTALIKKLNG